jgi:sarcosine dehydrogenase
MKKVVLLERNKLTSGTTWHTAGLVWSLRPNDTDIQLLASTRALLGRLEDETGIDPGYNQNGGLFLASTKVTKHYYTDTRILFKHGGIRTWNPGTQDPDFRQSSVEIAQTLSIIAKITQF